MKLDLRGGSVMEAAKPVLSQHPSNKTPTHPKPTTTTPAAAAAAAAAAETTTTTARQRTEICMVDEARYSILDVQEVDNNDVPEALRCGAAAGAGGNCISSLGEGQECIQGRCQELHTMAHIPK